MDLNWLFWLMALGLGLFVGAVILVAGIWIDKVRERNWDRELNAPDAPQDIVGKREGGHDGE